MSRKSLVKIGAIAGLTIGGYVPLLWGGNAFSFSSVFLGAAGGILGIYIMYKLSS